MSRVAAFLARLALLAGIWLVLWLAAVARLSPVANLSVIVGVVLLTFPLVWLGRWFLDRHPTSRHAVWTTTFVHCGLGLSIGVPLARAIVTHRDWTGWALPVPPGIGLVLVVLTGTACALTVATLALRGLGAPFFIALSRRLAADWLYAWTRNPMALAALAFFASLGVWFRSLLFVLWVLVVLAPALLFFIRVYEERELELRFGAPYLEYRAKTPMLFPRRPGG